MRIVYGSLIFAGLKPNTFNKNKLQAELRQEVKKYYPKANVNAGHDVLIGFTEEETEYISTRVVWVDVPVNSTEEDVRKALAKYPDARIQRVLSYQPELEPGDTANGIDAEEKSKTQMVRDNDGQPVLDSDGYPTFRRYFFKTTAAEDIDLRPVTRNNRFMPQWFLAEQELYASQPATTPATTEEELPFLG